MYTRRIKLINYGPIKKLDIEFPFDGTSPKPVVLVGENGSGKSVVLSQIVNGLVDAKGVAYPDTPEVESGKVYKLRSTSYIRTGSEYYLVNVEFQDSQSLAEMRLMKPKREYESTPKEVPELDKQDIWKQMPEDEYDNYKSSFSENEKSIRKIFSSNCVLYFPPNRFEEPAWLNERNLISRATYMNIEHISGHTSRRIIAQSSLRENQNWLFDLAFDRASFEIQTRDVSLPSNPEGAPNSVPIFVGYSGRATNIFNTALRVVRAITRKPSARFGIGHRNDRVVSLEFGSPTDRVPNIFQLSSGETSLLNLFLSILRDFDLSGAAFFQPDDIRGIVVIDEIDLHLHVVHQHEVLPSLMKIFPNVQFVVTTHSPLFVLGMNRIFGDDGFSIYSLPDGHRIAPEDFEEFAESYEAFTESMRFSMDIRSAILGAQFPIAYVEGVTDKSYIERAASVLGQESLLERFEIREGKGAPNLKKIWNTSKHIDIATVKTLLLFDCEHRDIADEDVGMVARRVVPIQADNPIQEGIENLFKQSTLEMARKSDPAFIDVDPSRTKIIGGEPKVIPDIWTVNHGKKSDLCSWLCQHGTEQDFERFRVIFELFEEALGLGSDEFGADSVAESVDS